MSEYIFTIIYLGLNAVNDIRKKQIILWTVPIYFMAGVCKFFFEGPENQKVLVVVGCLILLGGISILTRGSLGFGDVLIVVSIAIMMDMSCFFTTVGVGFLLMFVYSGACLMIKTVNRNTEIPFIPFLFLGYMSWGLI